MYAFGKLMEMLTTTGISINDLCDALPQTHVSSAHVRCPWEHKGRIMRELTRECDAMDPDDGHRIELIDGIKLIHGDEWVLVLPDASEPVFHIYAECSNPEASLRLVCR